MTPFEQCAALMLKLSVDELAEIKARSSLLIQRGPLTSGAANAGGVAEAAAETDADLCLDAISQILQAEGVEYAHPSVLKRNLSFRKFEREKVAPVMLFFRKIESKRVPLRGLMRLSARLLYDDMVSMSISPSSRTMLNHWHRVPAVINKNFPGYAKAGLGHLLLESADNRAAKYVSNAS